MSTTPSPSSPTIQVRRPRPGTSVVMLGGEHDLATAPELDRTLSDALRTCSHLIVDLSKAEFIDSTTIAVLVKAKKDADAAGCAFNLVLGTTPIVERALEICNLLPVLNGVASLGEALTDSPPLAGAAG